MMFRPRAGAVFDSEHGEAWRASEVFYSDRLVDTGLLDQFGRPILREREPIGFRVR